MKNNTSTATTNARQLTGVPSRSLVWDGGARFCAPYLAGQVRTLTPDNRTTARTPELVRESAVHRRAQPVRSNKQNIGTVVTGMLVGLCLAVGIIAVNEQEPTVYDQPPTSVALSHQTATR